MLLGNPHDGFHVAALSKEMHGHNGFGVFCDGRFDLCGIEIEGIPVYIYKYRTRIIAPNRRSGGKESEGRGDHFITISDIQSLHSQYQRVGAGSTADGVFDAQIFLHFVFKFFYLSAHDVVMFTKNLVQLRADGGHQRFVLGM